MAELSWAWWESCQALAAAAELLHPEAQCSDTAADVLSCGSTELFGTYNLCWLLSFLWVYIISKGWGWYELKGDGASVNDSSYSSVNNQRRGATKRTFWTLQWVPSKLSSFVTLSYSYRSDQTVGFVCAVQPVMCLHPVPGWGDVTGAGVRCYPFVLLQD